MRQALADSVSSARERRGHTSAYSSTGGQSEELSIVNATHLVASTATRLFDVLEAFVLQQPVTLQAAEAFRYLVQNHLHPNKTDSSRGVFTLQAVADDNAVRHAAHDVSAVPSLVRAAAAHQAQQTHVSQWRSTPFQWSLVAGGGVEGESQTLSDVPPILVAKRSNDSRHVSPPRHRFAVEPSSPGDAQRAKELIARLRQ
jgi:hypothetical protein